MGQRLAIIANMVATAVLILTGGSNVYLNVITWLFVVITTIYAAEVAMALYRARLWYNVMVVSMAMSLPQTLFAIKLAESGKPLAAWIDTLGSTLVDAMLVTAVLRRYIIGSPMVWSMLPFLFLWSLSALYVNYHTHAIAHGLPKVPEWVILLVGVFLPLMLVRVYGWPSKGEVFMLVTHGFSTGVASYYLADAVSKLPIHEVQLGVVATILATLPDFLVALTIRTVVARILDEVASEEEALKTMLAAAVHDQVLIPALVLMFYPNAAHAYPHMFNVLVVLLKFTLLDRRVYWYLGFPLSIIMLINPPV